MRKTRGPGKSAAALLAASLAVMLMGCGEEASPRRAAVSPGDGTIGPAAAGDEAAEAEPLAGDSEQRVKRTLYFADTRGQLTPEIRELPPLEFLSESAHQVVQALLDGPRRVGLTPVLPAGAGIRAVHFAPDGTAYVDLDSGFPQGLSGGSEDALIAVRSLTETLAANFEEIARVKILVEGEEVRDLGGHLDLSRPLLPAASLLGEPMTVSRRSAPR